VSRRHIALSVKAEALDLIARGLPSRTIAAQVGVDHATVCRWAAGLERPERKSPDQCRHTSIEARRGTYTCRACGATVTPPRPPVDDATPPEWATGPAVPLDMAPRSVTIPQPSWRTE
jgi:hypothetical protein